jgi:hypothetical protein
MDQFLKDELRKLIRRAAELVDRESFGQEPNYTAAFFGKLQGEKISNGKGQYIELKTSISNDRGPKSAESLTGIDIGFVFQWFDAKGLVYEKAILMQAKNHVAKLGKADIENLFEQCAKMSDVSKSFVVMDCPFDQRPPNIYDTDLPNAVLISPPVSLDDYLIDYVFPCTRGDDDPKVLKIARRADRTITVKTNGPKPKNAKRLVINPGRGPGSGSTPSP